MSAGGTNILLSDRDLEFYLYEVLKSEKLCELPYFSEHSKETFDMFLASVRRFARQKLYGSYKQIDQSPPKLIDGSVSLPKLTKTMFQGIVDLGMLSASRPESVGGLALPMSVFTSASLYLMAANLSVYGFSGLTLGAAHLIEAFGTEALKQAYMTPMYEGRWTGTMALTEPQAGSSLADITTSAMQHGEGHYLIRGSKIFISGGDHDLCENIVHLTLARIEGAPAGAKGISLFAVPKRRVVGDTLVDNDVNTAGLIHKIGWKGLPSLAMSYGEKGDCHGYLVGEVNRGLACMFQMMNEARIMIGANGVATASVAYQEALLYAKERPQGRRLPSVDAPAKAPSSPQVPIVEHADVRRMLLRQKAIVEGGMSVVVCAAHYSDLSLHGVDEEERERAGLMLDLLTPIAKSFPAEKGFEGNALALQVHGGYGYTSEYGVEAWLRDQKLNTIHEGTTGIQSLDLLGRKVVTKGGKAMLALAVELRNSAAVARGVDLEDWALALEESLDEVLSTTQQLAELGMKGRADEMLRHSADYLDMFSTLVVGWQLLLRASAAKAAIASGTTESAFYEGKIHCAQYWFATEIPRVEMLAKICRENDDSYAKIPVQSF